MPSSTNNSIALTARDQKFLELSSDSFWRPVLDALPDCLSIHSASGKILWANSRLCDLYGKSLSELQDLSCEELFHHAGVTCPHEQVVESGEAIQLKEKVLVQGKMLSVVLLPWCDDQGKTRGFLRLIRDDTSARRANAQLREAERFATLGQLLSGVAHDVGTPLNVISGYAEFLLMRTKPDGQGYKELTAILEQTRRIAAVFGEALNLSRSPQGRIDAIEIKALLSDSLVLVGHHLRRGNVKASITCRITPPLIYGEAAQLRQAFFNLLVNAAEQVGGGGRLHVVIDPGNEAPGFVGITFEGTDANEVAHDFSESLAAFISGGEDETAGIGLHLAKSILEDVGGKTTPGTGEQGKGLTVYLPIKSPGHHQTTMTSR